MSTRWNEDRRALLQAMQNIGSAGRAEGAPPESIPLGFYPVAEHLRLLDPDVVLVVGPRGSGKTEIARVLTVASLFDAVKNHAPNVRLPKGDSEWLSIYPAGSKSFEGLGLRTFMEEAGDGTETLREMWFAYLVRALGGRLDQQSRTDIAPLLEPEAANVQAIHAAFRALGTRPIAVLDRLDEQLEKDARYLFATYDELDTLGNGDWKLVEGGVRGLVALWAAYARRWRRIRAKLFLRTDLYERHAKAGGADLAKLAAGRVELVWSDRDLYGLLLKRLANVNAGLATYVQAVKDVSWSKDSRLGSIPTLRTWQDARPVVERMVGNYMGANQKKGLVYRWLLDHVRDGLGRGYPRPFVRLMEEGARQELDRFGNLPSPRLLEPASLRRALDRVSNDHVAQSKDEWPWLEAIKGKLRGDPLVPYSEREAIKLLAELPKAQESAPPPLEGRDLLDYLLELGIFRRRPDGRIDAPDLFLSGLGLKRKGGVRRGR
jgi:hypothetical protein